MNLYAWLCGRVPRPLVDWGYILVRAALIVLVVLYSDLGLSDFTYFKQ